MHHIVCKIGSDDNFQPVASDGDTVCVFTLGAAANPMSIRNDVAAKLTEGRLGLPPVAEDILHLAMAAYSADLYVRRATGSGYDSWTRNFHLYLPVTAFDAWQEHVSLVTEMLSFLTGDHWELSLRSRESEREDEEHEEPDFQPTAVSLFSGGLDSFIGGIQRLEAGDVLALVGHHGAGTTNQAQQHAYDNIQKHYEDKSQLFRFYVQAPTPEGSEAEKSTRSRSILFLALGTAVACGYDKPLPLYVPENGLISLNPPLTDSRMGSLSTRTTHPHFLTLYRQLLDALSAGVIVVTPYRFMTKGEMAESLLKNKAFSAGLDRTVSCSHPDVGRYQGSSPGQNCGYCVPCIIRRAALARAGLDDPARYLNDLRTTPPSHGSETGRDLRAFQMALERFNVTDNNRHLFDVLSTGPIPPEDIEAYADVYRRGMTEVQDFLYPPA